MTPVAQSLPAMAVSLRAMTPELIVLATAVATMFLDLFTPREKRSRLILLALTGVVFALVTTVVLPIGLSGFSGAIVHDGLSAFALLVILSCAAVVLLFAGAYLEWEPQTNKGEFPVLLLFSLFGMMVMAKGTDLLTVFLGLEIISVPLYALVAFHRSRFTSVEGALKYFLLGAFATAFLLYGVALLYSATGTTKLSLLAARIPEAYATSRPLLLAGAGFLLVGFSFKVALVPFQMWTPDAYEGAPTLVTSLMASAVKAAVVAAFVRVLFVAFPSLHATLSVPLYALAVATMVAGNLAALSQTNLKRLLAYSSIAHAGYIAAGLVSGNLIGGQAVLFYLFAYGFATLGAFGVVMALCGAEDDETGYGISRLSGAGFRHPVLGALLTLFLLSLAGIPPTAGFAGKLYLFESMVAGGHTVLAVIGVLASAVSLWYYLRIVVQLYMVAPNVGVASARPYPRSFAAGLAVCAVATLWLGLSPAGALAFAERAILSLHP